MGCRSCCGWSGGLVRSPLPRSGTGPRDPTTRAQGEGQLTRTGASRTIPLPNASARTAVADWKRERASWPGADTSAQFLNRRGGRLSDRAVNLLLDEIDADADVVDDGRPALSAHTLRHTFGTNLTRSGVDVVTVAQLMGHKRLETARRYTLPTQTDMEAAVAHLLAYE
ncbi:tyrosine-type recombinase/integrase [Nocardiopsis sp. YSL2]|uniref:tyrosine-type recombinase/integrase n=1 Tax=Nocardiopsis sp. YSL2 TaxID=2939492 RepID=UPI0026F45569|nr:tyrosine-type recombinase/integrase [Nocardiopsis sp. YSL2]